MSDPGPWDVETEKPGLVTTQAAVLVRVTMPRHPDGVGVLTRALEDALLQVVPDLKMHDSHTIVRFEAMLLKPKQDLAILWGER